MQLDWNTTIAKLGAVHVPSLNYVRAKFDSNEKIKAVYFETRNFGWIILRDPDENGHRIYKY